MVAPIIENVVPCASNAAPGTAEYRRPFSAVRWFSEANLKTSNPLV
jgi:hypothetical protein